MPEKLPDCSCGESITIVWEEVTHYDQPFSGLSNTVSHGFRGCCGNGCKSVSIAQQHFPLPESVTVVAQRPARIAVGSFPPPEFSGDNPDWYLWIP